MTSRITISDTYDIAICKQQWNTTDSIDSIEYWTNNVSISNYESIATINQFIIKMTKYWPSKDKSVDLYRHFWLFLLFQAFKILYRFEELQAFSSISL